MPDTSAPISPPSPLEVESATKSFGKGESRVRAVDSVSLRVEPGTFTAIMGKSGSGKSTLLHLAAGLTRPDTGAVRVAGEDLAKLDDKKLTLFRRRQIGLVFQSFNLIPTLTAAENVALPLTLDRVTDGKPPKDRARELLGMLDIADRASHRPDAMSGGEQQRVAIARALVADPALILADEPTGNLDSANGEAVCKLLRDLAGGGRTIVMVTHEPSVAAWCHRCIVLKDGRLADDFAVSEGDADAVAQRYRTAAA